MMTTASAGMPSMNPAPVQASHQPPDGTKKRPRAKSVTWASPQTLIQVRLFEAEDAPSLSGLVLQDLLEAKKTRFMHTLVPVVSTDDLPPGFEGGVTKRARLDSAAILAMNAEIAWQLPERVQYDRSWQVASGNESAEVNLQHQREVKVLEAVYPRPSAVPISPVEPLLDAPSDLKDGQILEIPLIPTEDEEDEPEEDNLSEDMASSKPIASDPNSGGDKAASVFPPGYFPPKDGKNLASFNSDLTSAFLKNADPDVAAAAAAAYAVLRAKESGALIDHDLLIKILSNPLSIETLTASNPSLRNQLEDNLLKKTSSNRFSANGNGMKIRSESSLEGSLSSSLMMMQGRQVMQGWGSNLSRFPPPQGVSYPMVGAHEHLSRGAYMSSALAGRAYPIPYPDVSKELTQQQGRLVGPKIRKQCFFFNTPRGCRNGIHCNFLHELASEKTEKMQLDAGPEAQPNKEETTGAGGTTQ